MIATSPTIRISQQDFKKGVVSTYYLTGKKALALDRLVEEGLAEHRAGKTIMASSIREASEIYERRLKNGGNKKRN